MKYEKGDIVIFNGPRRMNLKSYILTEKQSGVSSLSSYKTTDGDFLHEKDIIRVGKIPRKYLNRIKT